MISEAKIKRMNAYFVKIIKNGKKATQCPEIARRLEVSHGTVCEYFGRFLTKKEQKPKIEIPRIKAVYKMPDGRVETYGPDNKLIGNLSGQYNGNLYERICRVANKKTEWTGFKKRKK